MLCTASPSLCLSSSLSPAVGPGAAKVVSQIRLRPAEEREAHTGKRIPETIQGGDREHTMGVKYLYISTGFLR
jgi:hypothetical protein